MSRRKCAGAGVGGEWVGEGVDARVGEGVGAGVALLNVLRNTGEM